MDFTGFLIPMRARCINRKYCQEVKMNEKDYKRIHKLVGKWRRQAKEYENKILEAESKLDRRRSSFENDCTSIAVDQAFLSRYRQLAVELENLLLKIKD
jgi:hypothetical protein